MSETFFERVCLSLLKTKTFFPDSMMQYELFLMLWSVAKSLPLCFCVDLWLLNFYLETLTYETYPLFFYG